jgi:lysophosphatidate acyltransferase
LVAAFLWIPYFATRPKSVLNLLWETKKLRINEAIYYLTFICRRASTILSPIIKVKGLKWHLWGAENLCKEEACVIVANHQSSLDILGRLQIDFCYRVSVICFQACSVRNN